MPEQLPNPHDDSITYLEASGRLALQRKDEHNFAILYENSRFVVFADGRRRVILDRQARELLTAERDFDTGNLELRAAYEAAHILETIIIGRQLNQESDLLIFMYNGGHFHGRMVPQNIIAPFSADPSASPNYAPRQKILDDLVAELGKAS